MIDETEFIIEVLFFIISVNINRTYLYKSQTIPNLQVPQGKEFKI